MAKILLVEDDNNLREIYEARLSAEGYDIVSARDGEEALTVAMKERPDLIISDVMMPKISGFDMLDIIRSTEETKNVKVIMMTALSQAEDKSRADKLGADRYLVKSQVTLEDVAKVAKEVLSGEGNPEANNTTTAAASDDSSTTASSDDSSDSSASSVAAAAPQTSTATAAPQATTADDAEDTTHDDEIDDFIESKVNTSAPESSAQGKKVIEPINDLSKGSGIDLEELAKKEELKEQMSQIAHDVAGGNTSAEIETTQPTSNPVVATPPSENVSEAKAADILINATDNLSSQNNEDIQITEDGELITGNEPAPASTAIPAALTPPADPVATEAPAAVAEPVVMPEMTPVTPPVIPHDNGTNIDGVVPQTPPASTPAQTPPAIDPNSIAL